MSTRLLILLSLIFCYNANGQIASFSPSIPTSPQGEAVKSYGLYEVNPSTGTPDISIPLYEINHYGYKLPLSLRYVAKPIKPGYNFDVLGFGWGLSINSCISRSIEYLPDEFRNFTLDDPSIPCNLAISQSACLNDNNFARDKFNVVLPNGSSFDFIIENQNGVINFKISDARQVKISLEYNQSAIQSFTVTDEDGVKYTFIGSDYPRSNAYYSHSGSFVTWSLSRIDIPGIYHPITFSYGVTLEPFATTCGEMSLQVADYRKSYIEGVKKYYHEYVVNRATAYTPSAFSMKLITQINFGPNGLSKVNFSYLNHNSSHATKYLDKIEILEGTDLIKSFSIHTSTSGGQSPCFTFTLAKLDSVVFKGRSSTIGQSYKFIHGPRGFFSGIDHWGNLNSNGVDLPNYNVYLGWDVSTTGHLGNGSLTAVTKEVYDPSPFYKVKVSSPAYSFSDCKEAATPNQHAVLGKIIYPTGGWTEFEYENHLFLTSIDGTGNMEYTLNDRVVKKASSFRIRTITNFTSEGIVSNKKNYRYGKYLEGFNGSNNSTLFEHSGYGEAVVDPNIETYLNYAEVFTGFPINNMVLGKDLNGQFLPMQNIFYNGSMPWEWGWSFTLSPLNFRRALNGRQQVVYSEVTVYEGDINEVNNEYPLGKTVYKYDLNGENTMPVPNDFFEPLKKYGSSYSYEPKSYLYNRLIEKSDYKFDQNLSDFKKIRSEIYEWIYPSSGYPEYLYGFNFLPEGMRLETGDINYGYHPRSQYFYFRECYIGGILLYKKTTFDFSETSGFSETSDISNYNDRHQLTSSHQVNSKAETIIKRYKYPDLIYSGDYPLMSQMVSKNIISPVIEYSVLNFNSNKILSGKRVDYGEFGSTFMIKPSKAYELIQGSSNADFLLEGEVVSYTPNGNVVETISKNNYRTSFIWGYDDRYLIAQISNASISDVAYSSFEEGSKGNWNYSGTVETPPLGIFVPTGKRYYSLTSSSAITKSVNIGQTYIVSYWRNVNDDSPFTIEGATGNSNKIRTVNGWSLFQHIVNATGANLSVVGNGLIDELRLYPSNAMMISFTHDPLIGTTTKIDITGDIQYYYYDYMGRLSAVRDVNKNILKQFCYNYNGQEEPCKIYYNSVQNQNFTRNNCQSGLTGNQVSYSVPAGTYSAFSQAEADQMALNDIAANGQAYANANGTCSQQFFSTAISDYFANGSCGAPEPYYVTLPYGQFTSSISQADADNKAYMEAQRLADQYGACLNITPLYGSNSSTYQDYIIQLSDVNSNAVFYFYLDPSTSDYFMGEIPWGYYNVSITPIYEVHSYSTTFGCDYIYNNRSGTINVFTPVPINDVCNLFLFY